MLMFALGSRIRRFNGILRFVWSYEDHLFYIYIFFFGGGHFEQSQVECCALFALFGKHNALL